MKKQQHNPGGTPPRTPPARLKARAGEGWKTARAARALLGHHISLIRHHVQLIPPAGSFRTAAEAPGQLGAPSPEIPELVLSDISSMKGRGPKNLDPGFTRKRERLLNRRLRLWFRTFFVRSWRQKITR